MENSWAKFFAEEICLSIDKERFRVLYSDRTQCRTNTSVRFFVQEFSIFRYNGSIEEISCPINAKSITLRSLCSSHLRRPVLYPFATKYLDRSMWSITSQKVYTGSEISIKFSIFNGFFAAPSNLLHMAFVLMNLIILVAHEQIPCVYLGFYIIKSAIISISNNCLRLFFELL